MPKYLRSFLKPAAHLVELRHALGSLPDEHSVALLDGPAPGGADILDLLVNIGQRRLLARAAHIVLALLQKCQVEVAMAIEQRICVAVAVALGSYELFGGVLAHQFEQLTVLSIAPLIAKAIHEVFEDGSVTSLFDG